MITSEQQLAELLRDILARLDAILEQLYAIRAQGHR
jgi:hypothetical protein